MLRLPEVIEEHLKVLRVVVSIKFRHQDSNVGTNFTPNYSTIKQRAIIKGAWIIMISRIVLWINRKQHPVSPVYLHFNFINECLIFSSIQCNKIALQYLKIMYILAWINFAVTWPVLKFSERLFPAFDNFIAENWLRKGVDIVLEGFIDNHLAVILENIDESFFTDIGLDNSCGLIPVFRIGIYSYCEIRRGLF